MLTLFVAIFFADILLTRTQSFDIEKKFDQNVPSIDVIPFAINSESVSNILENEELQGFLGAALIIEERTLFDDSKGKIYSLYIYQP